MQVISIILILDIPYNFIVEFQVEVDKKTQTIRETALRYLKKNFWIDIVSNQILIQFITRKDFLIKEMENNMTE